MAPVATGVAYAEENGFVFSFRFIEGFLTPRIPVNGVVSVLKKIGAFFINQPVWLFFLVWLQKLILPLQYFTVEVFIKLFEGEQPERFFA